MTSIIATVLKTSDFHSRRRPKLAKTLTVKIFELSRKCLTLPIGATKLKAIPRVTSAFCMTEQIARSF